MAYDTSRGISNSGFEEESRVAYTGSSRVIFLLSCLLMAEDNTVLLYSTSLLQVMSV